MPLAPLILISMPSSSHIIMTPKPSVKPKWIIIRTSRFNLLILCMGKLCNLQYELDHFTPPMRQVEPKVTFCKMSFYVHIFAEIGETSSCATVYVKSQTVVLNVKKNSQLIIDCPQWRREKTWLILPHSPLLMSIPTYLGIYSLHWSIGATFQMDKPDR